MAADLSEEQRAQEARSKTLQMVFAEGTWLSAEELNALHPGAVASGIDPASDWKRGEQIFSVKVADKEYFAAYQFDPVSHQPLPIIAELLKTFDPGSDPWSMAVWFHFPNGWLARPSADGGRVPAAPKDVLDQRQEVLKAAENRRGTYVA